MTYTVYCVWLEANHFLFQIANVFLLLSYFCPPNHINGLIYLRLTLGLAGLFFALWGWLVLCALDTAVWNLFFFVGNMVHLLYILLLRRTKEFSSDMEIIYEEYFKPLSVPRHQFHILAVTAKPKTEIMSSGKIFANDGDNTRRLSIMMAGRMEIKKQGLLVNVVKERQFIDSPEWVVSQEQPYTFEVTIICKTRCRVVYWERVKLLDILKRNPYLKAVTNSIVSADVARIVFAMTRNIGTGMHSIYSWNEIGHHKTEVGESEVNEENIDWKTGLLNDNIKETEL